MIEAPLVSEMDSLLLREEDDDFADDGDCMWGRKCSNWA